jgi:hypothetical protein
MDKNEAYSQGISDVVAAAKKQAETLRRAAEIASVNHELLAKTLAKCHPQYVEVANDLAKVFYECPD